MEGMALCGPARSSDILWQNTVTGQRYLWLMNGTDHQADVDLGIVDSSWQIVR